MSQPSIRLARESDCAEIARLASQLGYPATGEMIRPRLRRLLGNSKDVVYVAKVTNGGLGGWIHGFLSQLLESDLRVEIGGLVVDDRLHRQGIGRALVQEVERWAIGQGVAQVSVRCQIKRTEAHQFYGNLGYDQAKTQIVFRKPLTP